MSLIVEAGRARQALSATKPPESETLPPAASSEVDGFIHLDEKLRFTFLNPTVVQWLGARGVDGGALVGQSLEAAMKCTNDRSNVADPA